MTSSSSLDFYRAPNSQWIIGPFSSGDLDDWEDMGVERWMTVHLHCLWLVVELLLYHIWSIELTMFCCLLHQSSSSWYFWGIDSKPVRFRMPSFGGKRFEGSHSSARAAGEKGLSRFMAPNSHLPHTVSWIHKSIMDPLGLPAISRCPYFFDRVSFREVSSRHLTRFASTWDAWKNQSHRAESKTSRIDIPIGDEGFTIWNDWKPDISNLFWSLSAIC